MSYATNEEITATFFIEADGDPVLGATVTAKYGKKGTAFSSWTSTPVTEEGGGFYRADFTPDSAGHWGIRGECSNPKWVSGRWFPVGIGQDDDIETKIDTIDGLVDTLIARLTAPRAGYLDELAAANVPADIDTLLVRLSAIRAGYLDYLNSDSKFLISTAITGEVANSIANRVKRVPKFTSVDDQTHSHADNTNEQTIVELTPSVYTEYKFQFDFTNLTQDATLKVYKKVKSTGSYVEFPNSRLTIGTEQRAGMESVKTATKIALKLTLTSSIAEGASRDVDFNYGKWEYD